MTQNTRQVVVAYDFSDHGSAVLARAIGLVSRAPFHVLHFVNVIEGKHDYQYADEVREKLANELKMAFAAADIGPEVHFFIHTRMGKPAEEILDLATEIGADLIFIGTHGHTGIKARLMGSVAEKVVREAGCPVMVVRAKTYPDVELDTITEVPEPKHVGQRLYRFSYSNNAVIMRPPDWTIH